MENCISCAEAMFNRQKRMLHTALQLSMGCHQNMYGKYMICMVGNSIDNITAMFLFIYLICDQITTGFVYVIQRKMLVYISTKLSPPSLILHKIYDVWLSPCRTLIFREMWCYLVGWRIWKLIINDIDVPSWVRSLCYFVVLHKIIQLVVLFPHRKRNTRYF